MLRVHVHSGITKLKRESFKNQKNSNKYFTIFFKKLTNKNNKKLNISFIAKKKLGNAVKRNKIKRKLRNITNEAVNKLSLKFDYSYFSFPNIF